jgi:4-cresol dehydrogenase (hydroxylating)
MINCFPEALQAWTDLLGRAHVIDVAEALDAASTTTFATTQQVLAIIRPGSRAEVQECVRIAGRFNVAIYPISAGRNWGYGSRVPAGSGVLLDLGRLNGIVAFDEDLAYVTVEPGVTQRQLHEFLRRRNSRLWMDATGASPDCSIIGNTLERGFGHTPMGDHAGQACGLEVVLTNGEVIETGFGRFGNSGVTALHQSGVGPSLDGLFLQSNFGIVTRMSVWLMPAPEHFEAFFFLSRREDGLGPVVDALRPLRMDGTLRSVMHIGNDYKVVAGSRQFPWTETGGLTPLGRDTMARIRRELGIGAWNGSGGLYGTRRQVREAKRRLKDALTGKVDRLQFLDDRRLALLKRFAGPARWVTGWDVKATLAVLDPVYHLLKGVPTEAPMASTYWRMRMPVPAQPDPDRDGCGLLWCSPVVPNTGRDIAEATGVAEAILLEHGFEPQMSVSLVSGRAAICVITICYDRAAPGEDVRALECYRRLAETLVARGYPPYRLNVGVMDLVGGHDAYAAAVGAVRLALDPQGILAPGRYETPAGERPPCVTVPDDRPARGIAFARAAG